MRTGRTSVPGPGESVLGVNFYRATNASPSGCLSMSVFFKSLTSVEADEQIHLGFGVGASLCYCVGYLQKITVIPSRTLSPKLRTWNISPRQVDRVVNKTCHRRDSTVELIDHTTTADVSIASFMSVCTHRPTVMLSNSTQGRINR